MEPKEFLKCYLQGFRNQEADSARNEDAWKSLLLSGNYYYRNDNHPERYVDTLSRSDLLGLIQNLGIIENLQHSTPAQLISQVNRLREETIRLQTEVTDINTRRRTEIERLNSALGGKDTEIERLNAEIERLDSELSRTRDTVTALYASTSWKITLPLRLLSRALTKSRHFLGQSAGNAGHTEPSKEQNLKTALRYHVETFEVRLTDFGNKVLHVVGWCFSPCNKDPVRLEVHCDGQIVLALRCDIEREDVAASFGPEIKTSSPLPRCGFRGVAYLPEEAKSCKLCLLENSQTLATASAVSINHHVSVPSRLRDRGKRLLHLISYMRYLRQRTRGRIRASDLVSPATWRRWFRRALHEYRIHRMQQDTLPSLGKSISLTCFEAYLTNNAIKPHVEALLHEASQEFSYKPLISILMPVYNIDPRWLNEAINSVKRQIYPNWQLCIADDASTWKETRLALQSHANDSRIKIAHRGENGHICRASNTAAELATGEFIVLLDHDDLLAPNALFEIVRLLQTHPQADLIYSDEDKIDRDDRRYDPQFKPDWSPTLMLGYNYINHLTCIRRSLFEEVGRFRLGLEGAQDYDLLLRVIEKTTNVFHIPKILYHWRSIPESTASAANVKPIVGHAARRGLQDYLAHHNISASVYQPEFAQNHGLPIYQLGWPNEGPSVEIVIPTRNRGEVLRRCVDSIRNKTTYRNYQILVIDNDSDCPETLADLKQLQREGVRVERISNEGAAFSFSRINNAAIRLSQADCILLLNDDTEVIAPHWLSHLVGYLQLPGVGATGARLLFPDKSLQHAGVVLWMADGIAPDHAFYHQPSGLLSYYFLAETARECSALTAACLLIRRKIFLELGGFAETHYKVSMNDVDLCLRLWDRGLRCVYVPGAELFHYESLTRSRDDDPSELASFRKTYQGHSDPFYNPNLSQELSFSVSPECTLDYEEFLKRPLKVIFFTHNLNLEGAPKVILDLASELASEGTIIPIVLSPVDGPVRERAEEAGVRCHVWKLPGTDNILQGWSTQAHYEQSITLIQEFLQKEGADVAVANVINSFFVVEAASRARIPSLWIIHESYDQRTMLRNLNSFSIAACEAAFSKAYRVIFVSRETRELYRRYNRRQNFVVVHNAIRPQETISDQVGPKKAAARQVLDVSPAVKVICSVGTICERKDQETLVKAVARLVKKREDFICYLVGARETDPYLDRVRSLVRKSRLTERIILVPETREVYTYYRAADVFVFTSLNESFSLTILEAMAHGLPIITTPCQGIAEQVRVGKNALMFDFRDASGLAEQLQDLLDDPEKRHRMGENSRAILKYMQTRDEMLYKYRRLIFDAWQVGPVDEAYGRVS